MVVGVKKSVLQLTLVFTAVLVHFSAADSLGGRGTPRIPSTDLPLVEYLIGLRAQLADEDGIPIDLISAPTSIWCLKEKAVVNNEVRQPTAASEDHQCETITDFLFNWETVANTTSVTLRKSVIRVYMQVTDELTSSMAEEAVPVTISVSVRLFYSNMTLGVNAENVSRSTVTKVSNRWIELDITALMIPMWSSVSQLPPIVEVKLKTEVDCVSHKKVPFQFVNPAEVDLNNTLLREECMMSQPLLIVSLEDQALKKVLLDEQNLFRDEQALASSSGAVGQGVTHSKRSLRQKRSTRCHRVDFNLNFEEFGSTTVVHPPVLNISTCIGSCEWNNIRYMHHRVPLHASLIAEAKFLNDDRKFTSPPGELATMYSLPHKNPCCSPTKYSSAYLILSYGNLGYRNLLFSNIKATECQCR